MGIASVPQLLLCFVVFVVGKVAELTMSYVSVVLCLYWLSQQKQKFKLKLLERFVIDM